MQTEEWAVALFDFPGQTPEDLSFHKGALIQVTEHIDTEWRRGRVEGREGLYPVAFTQPCKGTKVWHVWVRERLSNDKNTQINTQTVSNFFSSPAQPITGQQPVAKGMAKALFDFTAESEDELTLKVCEEP